MTPFYKGFVGDIIPDEENFIVNGKYECDLVNNILKITELPIGKWTRNYKNFLEKIMQ